MTLSRFNSTYIQSTRRRRRRHRRVGFYFLTYDCEPVTGEGNTIERGWEGTIRTQQLRTVYVQLFVVFSVT